MRIALIVVALVACKGSKPEEGAAGRSQQAGGTGTPTTTSSRGPGVQAPTVDLAEVSVGYEPIELHEHVVIAATPTAISVDGKRIVALEDGAVPSAALEGGTLSFRVPSLTDAVAGVRATAAARLDGPVAVMLDQRSSYRTLFQILASAKRPAAGAKKFAIVARRAGEDVALRLALPDRPSPSAAREMEPGAALQRQLEGEGEAPSSSTSGPARGNARLKIQEVHTEPEHELRTSIEKRIRRAYTAGLRRCGTKGTYGVFPIHLRFTVSTTGRVSSADTKETGPFATCVAALTKGWLFPVAKDGDRLIALVVTMTAEVEHAPVDDLDRRDDEVRAVPVTLLAGESSDDHDDPPLQLVVSVTNERVIVWSISGAEGTLRKPLHDLAFGPDVATELGRVLQELVTRRWAGKTRHPHDRAVLFQADNQLTIATVAPLLGATRAAADGTELFPETLLMYAFE